MSSKAKSPETTNWPGWRKYDSDKDWDEALEKMLAELKRRHGGGLDDLCGRLVAEFGPDKVRAAMGLNPRRRGKPSKGRTFEDMAFAQCIDEWAADYRAAGKPNAVELALLDAFELESDDPNGATGEYLKTAKERRKNGRRELRKLYELRKRRGINPGFSPS